MFFMGADFGEVDPLNGAMFFLGADFGEGDPLNGAHVGPGPGPGPGPMSPWALYMAHGPFIWEVFRPYYSLVWPYYSLEGLLFRSYR